MDMDMNYDEHDEVLQELLVDFEETLRAHLKTNQEFQDLLDYLTHKHGAISLCVAAQVIGPSQGRGKKKKMGFKKKPLPLRFELNKDDMKFLRSLKISAEV